MAKELSDTKLSAILEQAVSNSEHMIDGKLATERREVERYYRGELPKPQHAGDSKYVSRDVFETVDSMRSTVIESFMANTRIVFFQPEQGETVEDAKQATDYTRHVFFKDNDGEDIMYDVMTDGLMKRLSVVKVRYEETSEEDEYEFDGLNSEELALFVQDFDEYEFTEADISEETGLFSGMVTVPTVTKKIVTEAIHPEDFLVSSRTADLKDAKYCIHRISKSKSDLLKEGYEKSKIEQINFSGTRDVDMEYEKQMRFDPVDDIISTDEGYDDSVKEITVHEIYIRLDMDNSGKNKLWKIDYAGGVILSKEQVSRMPFASFVPLPVPHTFFGENFAHSVIPVQNARTVLIRQIINHSLITNNPRMQVLNGAVHDPKELTDNRLGGIINVRRQDGIVPMPQAPLNPFVFNLISMIDEDKEETTGISKLSQGLNKDAVSTQNSEGMVEQLISQSQQRQKIIARRFGKFLKELYSLIYHTAVDYIDEAGFVDSLGSYVPVNPSQWRTRSAASIELTLGYGEQEREAQKWTEIDSYFSQDPTLSAGYDYARRYEVVTRALEGRGVEDVNTILTPPDEMKPPEPSEKEKMEMAQMQSQIEYQKAQTQAMLMKAQTDKMKAEADLIKAQSEAAHNQADSRLESLRLAHEREMDSREAKLAENTPSDRSSASFNINN